MKQKPRFKPTKGNKYRLILCDSTTIVTKDFKLWLDAPKILAKLQTDLTMKRMEEIVGKRMETQK